MIVSKFVVRQCKFVSVLEFTSEHILGIWIRVLVRFSKIAEDSTLIFFENMLEFISINENNPKQKSPKVIYAKWGNRNRNECFRFKFIIIKFMNLYRES